MHVNCRDSNHCIVRFIILFFDRVNLYQEKQENVVFAPNSDAIPGHSDERGAARADDQHNEREHRQPVGREAHGQDRHDSLVQVRLLPRASLRDEELRGEDRLQFCQVQPSLARARSENEKIRHVFRGAVSD